MTSRTEAGAREVFCAGGFTANLPLADVTDGSLSPTTTTASRWSPTTAAPCVCWCRTSTSGRARSGCAACGSTSRRSRGSGSGGYHMYGDPWREQRYWGD